MTEENGAARLTPKAYLIVSICILVALLDGFDLAAPAVTAMQLRETFGLTPTQLGSFFSAGTAGLLFGGAAGGILSDRVGRKPMLILTTLCFALGSLATALASSLEMLILFRLLTGIGLGAALPNVITIASEAVPVHYRGRAVTLVAAGATTGGASCSLLALWPPVIEDWRILYFCGAIGPALLLPALFLIPAGKPTAHKPAERGKTSLLFEPERRSATLIVWAASLLLMVSVYILASWLPSLLQWRGLDHVATLRVQLAFNVAGITGSIIAGWVLDRPAHQRSFGIALVFGCYIACVLALATVPVDTFAIYAAGALMGVTVCGATGVFYALGPALYPPHIRGTGVGMMMAVGRIGSIIGPLMAGLLLSAGYSAATVLMAMLPMVAVAGLCAIVVANMAHRQVSVTTVPEPARSA